MTEHIVAADSNDGDRYLSILFGELTKSVLLASFSISGTLVVKKCSALPNLVKESGDQLYGGRGEQIKKKKGGVVQDTYNG